MHRVVAIPVTTDSPMSVALVIASCNDTKQVVGTPDVVERPVTTIRHTCAVMGNILPRKLEAKMLPAVEDRATTSKRKNMAFSILIHEIIS